MSIRVIAHPTQLAWNLFRPVDSLPGTEDAHTDINFILSKGNFRKVGDKLMLADKLTLTISPIVRVLKTANQTADLLSHEQGHYDIGILIGRAMARELETLSAASPKVLSAAASRSFDLHRLTRMPVVQDDYDTATKGSQDAAEQARWKGLIATALAASTVDQLNSNDL